MKYIFLSIAVLACGVIFYYYYNELLVIKLFRKKSEIVVNNQSRKKSFVLCFYKNEKWESIEKDLIVNDSANNILEAVVNAWLNFASNDEKYCKNIQLESVMFSSGQVFISFDKYPFNKNGSIKEKYMFIVSLLKTINQLNIVQYARFLVHYQPINDAHLYFDKAWSVNS